MNKMHKINVFFIILLFVSFNLGRYEYDIGLRMTLADIVFILWFLCFLLCSPQIKLRANINHYYLTHLLIFALLIWQGLQAIQSPLILRGTTYYLQVIRNFIMLMMMTLIPLSCEDYDKINRNIFYFGVFFATIALFLYITNMLKFDVILKDSSLWENSPGYELGSGGFLRANGLVGDSNFYAIFLTMSNVMWDICRIYLNSSNIPV